MIQPYTNSRRYEQALYYAKTLKSREQLGKCNVCAKPIPSLKNPMMAQI